MADSFHDQLTAWIARKGFVWGPSPEIYNGLSGFYDYAPLGKLLKNNVEKVIRDTLVKNNFWEMECPIIMPKKVWEASGHLTGLVDLLIKDVKGNVYRADNLIEDVVGESVEINGNIIYVDGASAEQLVLIIKEKKITAPNGQELVPEIEAHNLMMKTRVGVDTEVYNRPETATTTYLPFIRYKDFFRDKLPFSVFQIGKAFRNEISPRQHIVRQREFTQAEGQMFIFKDQKENFDKFEEVANNKLPLRWYNEKTKGYENIEITLDEALKKGVLKNQAYAWTINLAYELFVNMSIPKEKIRLLQHEPEKKAFYADDAWDVEINTNSFGWTEVCGVHDRTDYDLTQHAKFSKAKLVARNESTGQKEVPHVLEIAFGTDRPTFALMDLFWNKDEEKNQEVFNVPKNMAPMSVAFFPLVKKGGLPEIAKELYDQALAEGLVAAYDQAGSVGRRYARMDEIGTPYCVTIDFDTVEDGEHKGTVTIRDRDSTQQKRVKKEDVVGLVKELLAGKEF